MYPYAQGDIVGRVCYLKGRILGLEHVYMTCSSTVCIRRHCSLPGSSSICMAYLTTSVFVSLLIA